MILSSELKNNHLVILILTDVMMDNARDFYKEFEMIIENKKDFDTVSFNFFKVNFMDSSGIGSLIKSASIVKNSGSLVNVYNINKSLLSVFRLSGLDTILSIHTNEEFFQNYPELKP